MIMYSHVLWYSLWCSSFVWSKFMSCIIRNCASIQYWLPWEWSWANKEPACTYLYPGCDVMFNNYGVLQSYLPNRYLQQPLPMAQQTCIYMYTKQIHNMKNYNYWCAAHKSCRSTHFHLSMFFAAHIDYFHGRNCSQHPGRGLWRSVALFLPHQNCLSSILMWRHQCTMGRRQTR